jgi:CRISPR-associated protein Csm1
MLKSAQRIKMERIGHIFNKVKPKDKQSFIDTQPFEIEYWKKNINWEVREDVTDDFSKKYYHALVPIEDRSVISKYDNEKLNRLVDSLGNDLLLISGDFWGIQKFIFDGVTTSKASKILRSRSAMVQLITYAVVDRIKQEFKGSEALLFGAGKFMILAKNENYHKIKDIQEELDSYFLENFFGQNGFIISSTKTTGEKLLNQKSMKSDLDALGLITVNQKLIQSWL